MNRPWRKQLESGKSAEAYYLRARHAWRRRIRTSLAVVVGFGFSLGILAWLYYPRFGHLLGPYFAGAATGVAAWIWDDPPEYIAKWKRGADGEHQTEKALKGLVTLGWHAFHDRQGKRGNLDHIVVGPGGVFLLDSKNLSGSITLESGGLTRQLKDAELDAFTYTRLESKVLSAAAHLKEQLEMQTSLSLWVQALVVVWGEFAAEPTEQNRVVYVRGDELRAWLARRPNRLSLRDQRLIELAVQAELVAPPFVAPEPAV